MLSILNFSPEQFEKFMAWARYLYWADVHRSRFVAWIEGAHDVADDRKRWELIATVSAWYATLWVVVEGWIDIPLSDPSVDKLLSIAPRYKELLRRYRNGVFHYQPRIIESRLVDFLKESDAAVEWIHLLHDEFARFYWEMIVRAPIPENLRTELRKSVIALVGWIPNEIPEARAESLREKTQQAISILQRAGDYSSPAGRDLIKATLWATDILEQSERAFQEWKAQMIDRIKRT